MFNKTSGSPARLLAALAASLVLAVPALSTATSSIASMESIEMQIPSGSYLVADVLIVNEGPFEFGFSYPEGTTSDLPYLPVMFAFLVPGGENYLGGVAMAYHPDGGRGVGGFARVETMDLGGHVQIDDGVRGGIGLGYGWFPTGAYRAVIATAPANGDVEIWVRPAAGSSVTILDQGESVVARGYDAATLKAFATVDQTQGLVAWHHSEATARIDVRQGFVGFMGYGLPREDVVTSPSGEVFPDFDFVLSQETGTFEASFPERTQIGPTCQDMSGRYCYLMYPNTLLGVDTENWGLPPPPPPR